MPKCRVNDIDIMYEAYGNGDTVVYLQSVLGGINPGAYYFAGRLSRSFRVIIWDGPNCGQSGTVIKDTPSEYHLACEYLAGLLDVLGESSVHIAGCSGGGEMGLLFSALYPDRVKSLAMYRPTDTSTEMEHMIIKARYFDIADAAAISMREAVRYSEDPPPNRWAGISHWLADLYRKECEKILGMNNRDFSRIITNWGKWMGNPGFYRANLSDDSLGQIKIPVLICPCPDDYHPERLAEDLNKNLPRSVCVPVGKYRSVNEIYNAEYDENPFGGFADFVNEYERFAENVAENSYTKE